MRGTSGLSGEYMRLIRESSCCHNILKHVIPNRSSPTTRKHDSTRNNWIMQCPTVCSFFVSIYSIVSFVVSIPRIVSSVGNILRIVYSVISSHDRFIRRQYSQGHFLLSTVTSRHLPRFCRITASRINRLTEINFRSFRHIIRLVLPPQKVTVNPFFRGHLIFAFE